MISRPATAADVPALSDLSTDSFVAKFGYLYQPEDLAGFLEETHSPHAVAASLDDPKLLCQVAEEDGALAGYCRLRLACGWPEHARGLCVVELKQLYTAASATGRGIGAALMDWALAEARARAADEMQISVWSENHGAQKFYARYGFEKLADITFRVGKQLDHEFLYALML